MLKFAISLSLFFWFTQLFSIAIAQKTIPFHLVNGYILIEAQVNQVKGKFLFDTGTPFNFMLNNNLIPLEKEEFVARGGAGSGQVLDVYKSDINCIKIGASDFEFNHLKNTMHTNFSFMQDSIASDILGTIGFETIKAYVLTIDYERQIIQLDSIEKKQPDLKKVCTFQFTNDNNLPEICLKASNGRIIKAYFDTGSQGVIKCTEQFFSELKTEKLLEEYSRGYYFGYEKVDFQTWSIKNISYNNVVFDLNHLSHIPGDDNKLSLGYTFLKNYVSVWDFKNKNITLYDK